MIQLTTPYDPGSLDPGKSYTHVQIKAFHFSLRNQEIELEVEYGYKENSVFTSGKTKVQRHHIKDNALAGTMHWSALVATVGIAGKSVYRQVGEGLYNHLVDEGIYPGTVTWL